MREFKKNSVLFLFFTLFVAAAFSDEYYYEDFGSGTDTAMEYEADENSNYIYDEDTFRPGFSYEAGAGLASSLLMKPYSYVDASLCYNFMEYVSLGLGVKDYQNLNWKFGESYSYFLPYVFYRMKIWNIKAGYLVSNENTGVDSFSSNLYFDTSFLFPLKDLGPGKIGIEVGADFWFSNYSFRKESKPNSGAFATAAATMLNPIKVYAGVKYYL